MVDDKTIDSILKLLPKKAQYYFTKASVPRALDEQILAGFASRYKLKGNTYFNVINAIAAAINCTDKNDMMFIGGSTFVVADALRYFNEL